eukprot:1554-Heterococcus_DN1.PRE.1
MEQRSGILPVPSLVSPSSKSSAAPGVRHPHNVGKQVLLQGCAHIAAGSLYVQHSIAEDSVSSSSSSCCSPGSEGGHIAQCTGVAPSGAVQPAVRSVGVHSTPALNKVLIMGQRWAQQRGQPCRVYSVEAVLHIAAHK